MMYSTMAAVAASSTALTLRRWNRRFLAYQSCRRSFCVALHVVCLVSVVPALLFSQPVPSDNALARDDRRLLSLQSRPYERNVSSR